MNEQEKEEWELEEHGCRPRVRRVKEVDDPLTYGVIGAAQKVHTTLGPGFVEATYQRALSLELVARKIPFDTEREFEVFYNGVLCGTYRADMVIGGTLIVELKAVTDLAQEHFAQTISYLRASGLQLALLVNFGARSLQVRRFSHQNLPSPNPKIP